jgi:hypothetical protein
MVRPSRDKGLMNAAHWTDDDLRARPPWDVLAVSIAVLFVAGLVLGWMASGRVLPEWVALVL